MKSIRLLIIAAFVLSFAGAVWMFIGLRRELETLRPAEPMGALRMGSDADLEPKLDKFLNQRVRSERSSYTCVFDLLGRDNLFAYVDRMCGVFERHGNNSVGLKEGFHEMARIEIDGTNLPIGLAEPMAGEDHGDALVKLFPQEIRTAADQTADARTKALFERGIVKQEAEHPR